MNTNLKYQGLQRPFFFVLKLFNAPKKFYRIDLFIVVYACAWRRAHACVAVHKLSFRGVGG